jgi:23S rRNA (cytidine1920-2'-O)/16S rRNA (cytidine1409-2'-O)-methyltransferase
MKKVRLDELVLTLGLADSLKVAQGLIMSGQVVVGDQRIDRPSALFEAHAPVRLKGERLPFVSRGGLKLQAAIEAFRISVEGLICADIGASTGGFTDCLLQAGAKKVYAVDVGRGLLHQKIQSDPRVVIVERTNARNLSSAEIPEALDLVVCDVSFISLSVVLAPCMKVLKMGAHGVFLMKPQFEATPDEIEAGGVVLDPTLRKRILERVMATTQKEFEILGVIDSPISGPAGNIEALLWVRRSSVVS